SRRRCGTLRARVDEREIRAAVHSAGQSGVVGLCGGKGGIRMQGMCTLDHATGHRSSTRAWPYFGALAAAALALGSSACGSGDDRGTPQMLAVLSAFPAEGAAVVEQATVTDTAEINGRTFRIGTLGGVPVIMGLTGIGLVNAATTTGALLDQFPV